jgi:hypothetical protein
MAKIVGNIRRNDWNGRRNNLLSKKLSWIPEIPVLLRAAIHTFAQRMQAIDLSFRR